MSPYAGENTENATAASNPQVLLRIAREANKNTETAPIQTAPAVTIRYA
jgi:hypothetical protein